MSRRLFLILLLLISFSGVSLRTLNYDKVPPFGETQDEFFYPWAGMTLFLTGVPSAWSLFPSYPSREYLTRWGINYPIVSPWVEKPPLYSLVTGGIVIAAGARQLDDVRLSTIRLVPLVLSFITIFSTGFLAFLFFGKRIGLIAAFLYATTPFIVMANRLSLVENLMTPLVMLTICLYKVQKINRNNFLKVILVGLLCGLTALTKNIGIILPAVIVTFYSFEKKFKEGLIVGAISLPFILVHPIMGMYYGWELFLNVLKDYQNAHALIGLPELVQTVFKFPTIGSKETSFLDGSMLAGYILLFASPFFLKLESIKDKYLFLSFPFGYILSLSLLESGQTAFSYFGWHVYPIFPFMMILLAKSVYDLYKNPEIFQVAVLYLILGFSSVRFILLVFGQIQLFWQWILAVVLLVILSGFYLGKPQIRKVLFALFILILLINILVIFKLNEIYPGLPQPLN